MLVGVELLIIVGTDVAQKRIDMVSTGLKLFLIKPVAHRFVNVVHRQLPRLKWILQIGIGYQIREKWQKTVRIEQLHE